MTSESPFVEARSQLCAVAAPEGGRVLLFGGYNSGYSDCNTVHEYDTSTGSYTLFDTLTKTIRGAHGIWHTDGKIYLAGGYPDDSVTIYDPASKSCDWIMGLSNGKGAAVLMDRSNKLHILGGQNNAQTHYVFDLETRLIVSLNAMPKRVMNGGSGYDPATGRIYLYSGMVVTLIIPCWSCI